LARRAPFEEAFFAEKVADDALEGFLFYLEEAGCVKGIWEGGLVVSALVRARKPHYLLGSAPAG